MYIPKIKCQKLVSPKISTHIRSVTSPGFPFTPLVCTGILGTALALINYNK